MLASLLARNVPRRAVSHSIRCMSTQNPQPPPPLPPPPSSSEKLLSPSQSTPSQPARTSALSLDFSPAENQSEAQRTGARSSKNSLSSIERRRRFLGRMALGVFAVYIAGQTIYMGRQWSEEELKAKKIVSVGIML
jgi:mitochondrial import inner membrane translocase subunit TIM50